MRAVGETLKTDVAKQTMDTTDDQNGRRPGKAIEMNETLINLDHEQDDEQAFIMPARRGIDTTAPGFDPDSYLDLVSEDVTKIQREKLREILARNAEVEYLQRHGLGGRTDVESFRNCVPVVSYGDLEPDIMRLVGGEKTPILTADPITEFRFSSGTTAGQPKFIPGTVQATNDIAFVRNIMRSIYIRQFPGFKAGGKQLNFAAAGKQVETPSGIKASTVSTNYFRSEFFQKRPHNVDREYCVPDAVILCEDANQGTYCHLLCALSQSLEIVAITSLFAVTVVAAVRALQNQWREICEDIRMGTVSAKVTELQVRSAVAKILKPNPDLARFIERECSKEDWEGILPRLFPNAHFFAGIMSGSMLQYVPALRHYAGDLPCVSSVYASSECTFIGLNINPKCADEDIAYMIWPEAAFFEFLPLDNDTQTDVLTKRKTRLLVEAADVELGKEYELVVTNAAGLYRYCIGDVLRVKGFRRTAPMFEFVRRKNVMLNINTDNTDEKELQTVVDKAAKLLQGASMELFDYTSTTDTSSLPGHYLLFWELVDSSEVMAPLMHDEVDGGKTLLSYPQRDHIDHISASCKMLDEDRHGWNLDKQVLQECANTLDESFNYPYRVWRSGNQIAPLELRVVKEGTFELLMQAAVQRQGMSPMQYKQPRFVSNNNAAALRILNQGVIISFRSFVTPSAEPL